MRLQTIGRTAILLLCAVFALSDQLYAQNGMAGCKLDEAGAQKIWSCPGGLTIIIENGARFSLEDQDHDGNVDLVRLWRGALLLVVVEVAGRDVEVITPQAIAAVRGTNFRENHRLGGGLSARHSADRDSISIAFDGEHENWRIIESNLDAADLITLFNK